MLEYFTYKKFKKSREEKESAKDTTKNDGKSAADANKEGDKQDESYDSSSSELNHPKTVLKPEDERFLEELLAQNTDGSPPPLPPRIYTYDVDWHSDVESSIDESKQNTEDEKDKTGKASDAAKKQDEGAGETSDKNGKEKAKKNGKEKAEKQPNRLSLFFTRNKKPADTVKPSETLKPDTENVTPKEAEREKKDLTRVLDLLNLSAKNNKAVTESKDSSDILQKFTQIFKDLVNGVPTAYDDLTKLFENNDGTINKLFEKLPSSLQKLVTQLPDKLTTTLAPEILAAAAESQGIKVAEGGMKGAAKRMLFGQNLANLVKKPGAIVGMLRAIVEVLKSRWPAFIGMNVIWSVALSLLLVVLWYCYKRGREERILREEAAAGNEEAARRLAELSEDEGSDENDKPAADGKEAPNAKEAQEAAEVVEAAGAAAAAGVIPVIITSPEGEQIAAPKEVSPTDEVPPSNAPKEEKNHS
ncbi:hypothetical protein THAR02_01889 [Trichoderma harzianum]|uniref:Ring-like domain-containing protein n=1 Tax=Trichoderma harzianum TaxID=5544 RepID=A0A0G0A164_TRIHA|nr:hypothetical protein THAR02_01889 [Trichoderma harzianum]